MEFPAIAKTYRYDELTNPVGKLPTKIIKLGMHIE
jgi:hypothetical protein